MTQPDMSPSICGPGCCEPGCCETGDSAKDSTTSVEYFEEVASQWDTMRAGFFTDTVREKALRLAQIQSGKMAADIGAGTGYVTEALLRHGLDVIAIDRSPKMLEKVLKKFSSSHHFTYRVGESNQLPLGNETVDYAFANMYLHHVESPETAIKEMARILKKGGRLVVTDLDEHDHAFLREEQHDRWLGFQHEAIRRWFEDAGLVNVEVSGLEENCCACSTKSTENADIKIFAAVGEKA